MHLNALVFWIGFVSRGGSPSRLSQERNGADYRQPIHSLTAIQPHVGPHSPKEVENSSPAPARIKTNGSSGTSNAVTQRVHVRECLHHRPPKEFSAVCEEDSMCLIKHAKNHSAQRKGGDCIHRQLSRGRTHVTPAVPHKCYCGRCEGVIVDKIRKPTAITLHPISRRSAHIR